MGKVFNSMVFGVLISVSLAFFNSSGISQTSLLSMLLNPTAYQNSSFFGIISVFGTGVLGAIVIGLSAIIRQDWVTRAGWMISLSSIVLAPFIDLFTFINAQFGYLSPACVNAPVCATLSSTGGLGQIIALLFAGIPFLYALWASVEYVWRGDS
jgi:hypothetical protein